MRELIILSCAVLVSAAPASAAQSLVANQVAASSDQQATLAAVGGKVTAPAAEKKICKMLPSSSSRMTEKVCLTKQEWRQVDEETSR
jgi:predicted transglutaminase-like cysteine proteinase